MNRAHAVGHSVWNHRRHKALTRICEDDERIRCERERLEETSFRIAQRLHASACNVVAIDVRYARVVGRAVEKFSVVREHEVGWRPISEIEKHIWCGVAMK